MSKKIKSDPVPDGDTWDLPYHERAKNLKTEKLIWVAKKYRVIRDIQDPEEEDHRLILLEGLSFFLIVPKEAIFWAMNELRPGTAEQAIDEQEPLHVEETAEEPVADSNVKAQA